MNVYDFIKFLIYQKEFLIILKQYIIDNKIFLKSLNNNNKNKVMKIFLYGESNSIIDINEFISFLHAKDETSFLIKSIFLK